MSKLKSRFEGERREVWIRNETADVLFELAGERKRQDERWGWPRDYPDLRSQLHCTFAQDLEASCRRANDRGEPTWATVLGEEFGEVLHAAYGPDLRKELLQLAAVCVNWIEHLDRAERRQADLDEAMRACANRQLSNETWGDKS